MTLKDNEQCVAGCPGFTRRQPRFRMDDDLETYVILSFCGGCGAEVVEMRGVVRAEAPALTDFLKTFPEAERVE